MMSNERNDPPGDVPGQSGATVEPVDAAAEDLETLVGRIRTALDGSGWFHLARPVSLDEFERIGSRLGTVELRTDIVVDPEQEKRQLEWRIGPARPGVYQAAALELHTDRPTAAVLAWYCVEPDAQGGATQLVDARPILAQLSAEELEVLARIRVGHARPDPLTGKETLHHAPLLERRGSGWAVFYVPWFVEPPEDDAGRDRLARFGRLVHEAHRAGGLEIRLERRQCLFIDNRRMLHGRGALPQDSRRHLVRLYLRADGEGAAAEGRTPAPVGRGA
jgi:alpha-ketoglutarate-dependent taurine dioxygenase